MHAAAVRPVAFLILVLLSSACGDGDRAGDAAIRIDPVRHMEVDVARAAPAENRFGGDRASRLRLTDRAL